MGDFARERGIENYVCEDCFCWPLFELEGGFGRVMDRVRRQLAPYRAPAGWRPRPRRSGESPPARVPPAERFLGRGS